MMSNKVNVFAGADLVPTVEEFSIIDMSESTMPKRIVDEYQKRIDLLHRYVILAENVQDITDERSRMNLFAKLSFGLRKASESVSWAKILYKESHIERKKAQAIALLDEFGGYLSKSKADGKDIKATDSTRKAYVDLSPNVIVALRREAYAEAICEEFLGLRSEFIQSISTLKAMCYGHRDERMLSSVASTETEE